jgi:hypothetical protein
MACGILVYKSKRRAAQTEPLFFYFYSLLEAFHARHSARSVDSPYLSFGRLFFWPPQLAASFMKALTADHAAHGLPRPQMIFDVIGDPRR